MKDSYESVVRGLAYDQRELHPGFGVYFGVVMDSGEIVRVSFLGDGE